MEAVRTIGMSVCVTAAVTGIFSMLLPDAGFDKVLKFAISLFFLTGLAAPFASGKLEFHMESVEWEPPVVQQELSGRLMNQFSMLAEQQLAAGVENALSAQGIPTKKVKASIHIDEAGSVSITRLEVFLPKGEEENAEKAAAAALQETGIAPDVFVEE